MRFINSLVAAVSDTVLPASLIGPVVAIILSLNDAQRQTVLVLRTRILAGGNRIDAAAIDTSVAGHRA